jgi:hypothetical protein
MALGAWFRSRETKEDFAELFYENPEKEGAASF